MNKLTVLDLMVIAFLACGIAAQADTPGAIALPGSDETRASLLWIGPLQVGEPSEVVITVHDAAQLIKWWSRGSYKKAIRLIAAQSDGIGWGGVIETASGGRKKTWEIESEFFEEAMIPLEYEDGVWTQVVTVIPSPSLTRLLLCSAGLIAKRTIYGVSIELLETVGESVASAIPAIDTSEFRELQAGNDLPVYRLVPRRSFELEDNRIWTGWPITETSCGGAPDADYVFREVTLTGDQHVEIDLNGEFENIHWDVPEFEVHPCQLEEIGLIAANGVDIAIVMRFWDKEAHARGEELSYPRFQTEDQIRDYLDYVRFIVRSLKGLVTYYVIWAEPTIRDTIQWVKVEDYIKVLRRTIPVIRKEYPEAKIVTAPTDYLIFPYAQDFVFTLVRSDVMPLVDAISWHPMYGTSPAYDFHQEYYYEYPQLVRRIKETAGAHGFRGEYLATELTWGVEGAGGVIFDPTVPWPMIYTQVEASKCLARAIVLHLGMGVAAGHPAGMSTLMPSSYAIVQNLCTIMAGHEAIEIPVEVDIDYEPIAHYGFEFPNGDRMLAVWTDGIAQDEDPGVSAVIKFPGLTAETITGIDVLHGFVQELAFEVDHGNAVVHDLLVRDYPIILRISK